MSSLPTPARKPERPWFSSGPTAKRPGWSAQALQSAPLGRSHRTGPGGARVREAIARTRAVLEVPDDWLLGIVPASDTGAVELAMWNLLGPRPVQLLAFENFGKQWAIDAVQQLKLDAEVLDAAYGEMSDLARVRADYDLVFPWNGTTSGVRVPNADFIAADRQGLVICDATSAAFAMPLDWAKLDAVTLSWQKALGGEAGHGMLALSPRAVERLESWRPAWPLPKIFRIRKDGAVDRTIFEGLTINTPSLLCVEDWLDALAWCEREGGLAEMARRTQANFAALSTWVEATAWVGFLCPDPAIRSETSVCLRIVDPAVAELPIDQQQAFVRRMTERLDAAGAAFDVASHREAPPGLRVWCGCTVEADDVEALGPWLDWAFASARQDAAASV